MEGTTQKLVALNSREEGCSLELVEGLVEGGAREVIKENLRERESLRKLSLKLTKVYFKEMASILLLPHPQNKEIIHGRNSSALTWNSCFMISATAIT